MNKNRGIYGLEFGCFIAAILIYAVLGSPTPDAPGLVEITIGGLLVVALARGAIGNLAGRDAAHILIYYGMSVPLVVGVVQGNPVSAMMRDAAAFLFLFLPLFAERLIERKEKMNALIAAFVLLGVVFSVRAILDMTMIIPESLTYFANAPAVLFAVVFLIGAAMQKKMIWGLVFFALAMFPVVAMSMTLQRASIAYVCLAIICFGVQSFKSRSNGRWIFALMAIAILIFHDNIFWLYESLSQKTVLFGSNMRVQEIIAVWDAVRGSIWGILFGEGWGGSFESPAVAGIRVNYSHNLLSAMLLKTGLVGLVLSFAYLVVLGRKLLEIFKNDFVLALALTGPFVISTILYASYKSFDYGILLLLIVVGSRLLPIASRE